MKRLSLLGFFGLMASVLAGCPIFSGDGNGWTQQCEYGDCTRPTSTPGCYRSSDCAQNETCGSDNQCHPGDCTYVGCSQGYTCVIDDTTHTASCQVGGTTTTTGSGGAATTTTTGSGGSGGGATTTTTTASGGAGGGATTTTTTASGGAGGGATTTTTTASGGAGGGTTTTTTTTTTSSGCGVDGTQGTCASGSICLSSVCWIACDPANPTACAGQQTLNTCVPVKSLDKTVTYNVCAEPTAGTECPNGNADCNGKLCINGYCK